MNNNYESKIKEASAKYEELLRGQLERVDRINASKEETDYKTLDKIVIGVCGGDGIGPIICKASRDILADLLEPEIKNGKLSCETSRDLQLKIELPAVKQYRTILLLS